MPKSKLSAAHRRAAQRLRAAARATERAWSLLNETSQAAGLEPALRNAVLDAMPKCNDATIAVGRARAKV
jgi:hypothetical protein